VFSPPSPPPSLRLAQRFAAEICKSARQPRKPVRAGRHFFSTVAPPRFGEVSDYRKRFLRFLIDFHRSSVTLRSFRWNIPQNRGQITWINPRKSASIPDAARGGGMRPSRKNPPIPVVRCFFDDGVGRNDGTMTTMMNRAKLSRKSLSRSCTRTSHTRFRATVLVCRCAV